jgi:DNA polymerase-1
VTAQTQLEPVFALYAQAYLDAGWPCVLPVPAETKSPPPEGFTGEAGIDTDANTLAVWGQTLPYHSIALRMPATAEWAVIGIDVDDYPKGETVKVGGQTLAALEAQLGPLPPTWISSARPAPSGIRFYRVPAGRYRTKLTAGSTGDIEVIQRHHRYAVVAPSVNMDAGGTLYAWWHPPTGPTVFPGMLPSPTDLPWLPDTWVAHLREGASAAGPAAAARDDGARLLSLAPQGEPCVAMADAITKAVGLMAPTNAGTRHDITIERVHHLVMLAAQGHPGLASARDRLAVLWEDLTRGEQRADEFERMWTTSSRKAVTAIGGTTPWPHAVGPDGRCDSDAARLLAQGLTWSAPQHPGQPLAGVDPLANGHSNHVSDQSDITDNEVNQAYFATYGPPATSLVGVLGSAPFDPPAAFDQDIAAAALERTWPGLRYAPDADMWFQRQADGRWRIGKRGHKAQLALLANLAPAGDASADKGTPEQARAARRARLKSSAGSSAVASKMLELASLSDHPSAIDAGKLDAEPEILWAGGLPWDLAASAAGPVLANIGWAEPHTHDAGHAPAAGPTPAWDAFCAAVWPDPELRAWALRVLSIGLTGYPDAALIILTGETGRGKSSVAQLVCDVLGSYGSSVHRSLLFGDNSSEKHVHELRGLRLAYIDESPHGTRGSTEHLKQITGGGVLMANNKYEATYPFAPTHTLVLTSNHEPDLSDPALVRRVRPIPCIGDPGAVAAARRALAAGNGRVWEAERPGVLAAMMTQAAAWLADRDSSEVAALPALASYVADLAEEDDPIHGWLTECTDPDDYGSRASDLYANFRTWWQASGLNVREMPTVTRWGRQLNKRGYPKIKRTNANYRGLVLKGLRLAGTPSNAGAPVSRPTLEAYAGQVATPTDQDAPQPTMLPEATDHDCPTTQPLSSPISPGQIPLLDTMDTMDSKEGEKSREEVGEEKGTNGGMDRGEENSGKDSDRQQPIPSEQSIPGADRQPVPALPRDSDAPALVITDGELACGQGAPTPVETVAELELPERLCFDLETGKADDLYTTPRGRFGVLAGYAPIDGGEPGVTTDFDAIARQAPRADLVINHNLWGYDLPVLARHHGLDLAAVDADATIDTEILARQIDPPMARDKGVDADRRYDLDSLAERLGLPGKAGSISDIAKRHKGYANIPPDDPELVAYTKRDADLPVLVWRELDKLWPGIATEPYIRREHKIYKLAAQMRHNGVCVDTTLLADRLAEQALRKAGVLGWLRDTHGIPFESASPLATKDGKAALEQAFARLNVPADVLPRAPKTGVISVGGDGMRELAAGWPADHPVAQLCQAVAAVSGERTIYETVRRCLVPGELADDGMARVHPKTSFRQASGRASVTDPGMTVFGKHGQRWREREVILPDPGHVMLTVDLSQVDMRGVAAHSQDPAYMALFEPGRDAHAEMALLLFGSRDAREQTKAINHGYNYGESVKRIAADNGLDLAVVQAFDAGMRSRFPGVVAWKEACAREGETGALLDNGWGRLMRPDPRRAWTQAPALKGQGAARDILWEGLLRLAALGDGALVPFLRFTVHDEIALSVPREHAWDIEQMVIAALTFEWRGVPILAAGQVWKRDDGTEAPAYGASWGQCYAKAYPDNVKEA